MRSTRVERKKPGRKRSSGPPQKESRWGFRGMTVRDWLELFIVPLSLVVIGLVFTAQQDVRQARIENHRTQQAQKIETQRAEAEQKLAEQRAQDEALQAYLDQMNHLMLEKDLLGSEEGDTVFTLAKARTTTGITQFDGEHNQAVTRFLSDSGLLRDPALLAKADLQEAKLHKAVLENANLADTNLKGANLTEAVLIEADFSAE